MYHFGQHDDKVQFHIRNSEGMSVPHSLINFFLFVCLFVCLLFHTGCSGQART